MKYLNYIFENENIQNYININQPYIDESSKYVIQFNIDLYNHILENISSFVAEDIDKFYLNIRDFIIQENVEFYNILLEADESPKEESKVKKGLKIAGKVAAGGAAGLLAAHLAAKYGFLGKKAQHLDLKHIALPSFAMKSAYLYGQGKYDNSQGDDATYFGRIGAGLKSSKDMAKRIIDA